MLSVSFNRQKSFDKVRCSIETCFAKRMAGVDSDHHSLTSLKMPSRLFRKPERSLTQGGQSVNGPRSFKNAQFLHIQHPVYGLSLRLI